MKTDKDKALQLIDQLIEEAEMKDKEHKAALIQAHKAQKAIGERFALFHLKVLKELICKLKS